MQNEINVPDAELFIATSTRPKIRVALGFTWEGANIFVGFVASPHRFPQPVFGGGFSPGGGALRGVGLKLHPSPRTHLHLDHPGTHMAAGWYIKSINQSITDNSASAAHITALTVPERASHVTLHPLERHVTFFLTRKKNNLKHRTKKVLIARAT